MLTNQFFLMYNSLVFSRYLQKEIVIIIEIFFLYLLYFYERDCIYVFFVIEVAFIKMNDIYLNFFYFIYLLYL